MRKALAVLRKDWVVEMRKLLILAGLLLLAACASDDPGLENSTPDQASPAYETIDIGEVQPYQVEGHLVVDVRGPDEFESGHIEGAINVPLSDLQKGEFGPLTKEESYIIICQSGNRSQTASAILAEAGYDIVNVSEGMSSWPGDVVKSAP